MAVHPNPDRALSDGFQSLFPDQFQELAYATHSRGARVFLDLAINHTGWGATLQDTHPEWFVHGRKRVLTLLTKM